LEVLGGGVLEALVYLLEGLGVVEVVGGDVDLEANEVFLLDCFHAGE
jgi:hypothetical protein